MTVEQMKIGSDPDNLTYGTVFERCQSELPIGRADTVSDPNSSPTCIEVCGEEKELTWLVW